MNKSELVADIASRSGLSQADSKKALEALVGSITDLLVAGGKLQLVGFGTFEVTKRSARSGRNPQTGETMKIAASKAPKFKPGKAFKDAIG